MKNALLSLIILLTFQFAQSQEIINDTLWIKDAYYVKKAELHHRKLKIKINIQEIDFGVYMIPMSNIRKGTYTLSIFRDKVREVHTIENTTDKMIVPVDYIRGYYYVKGNEKSMTEGYEFSKARVLWYMEEFWANRDKAGQYLELYVVDKNNNKSKIF